LISVDGTHCPINEPWSEPSTQWYLHKFHRTAVNYEVALDLFNSKVVWISGPYPAATHDLTIYKLKNGLGSKMPASKLVIADNGYQSKDVKNLSTPNTFDTKDVKEFKKRARARQETFNKRLEDFSILKECFRHDYKKHWTVD
jgi:DDE superfamily endonuclease